MSINLDKIDNTSKPQGLPTDIQISKLQAIIDTVADGIISIDTIGTIKSFNAAATRIFGYAAKEVLGKNIIFLMPEPYKSEHHNYLKSYLTTNVKKVIGIGREAKGLKKDGSIFPMELSVSETTINNERLFIGTIRDITTTKKNEELIARLGNIVNDSSDEIYILGCDDLTFIQTNESARANLRYTTQELKKISFLDLLSSATTKTFSRLLSQLHETGSSRITFETDLKRKDGSYYPVEAKIYLSSFELEDVYVTIIQDITERKLTERSLKEKNSQIELRSRYDRVARLIMAKSNATYDADEVLNESLVILADELDYHSSAIYLFDEWTGCLHLKASYAPPTGIKALFKLGDGLIGQAAAQKKAFIIDDHAEDFLLTIDTGIMSIKPKALLVYPFSYQERIVGVIALASLKKTNSNDSHFIESLLSQLAVSLNSLKQYNDLKELSDQLKKRGREIAEKNAELEQANRMKSEFLANISHELRTPLNAVIGFSEVLKDGILGDLNTKQEEYASDIFKSGQHLLSLINDILDLSKIEAGKMTLDPELVNMKELIRNSVSIVKERAFAKRITLTQSVDDDISPILADARQIKQIVYNLLSNAVKFTPNEGKVSIHGYRSDNNFIIDVKDNGIGISAADQTRLFKPFEQLDSSVARKYEGTGLGLVLARRFAELHSGTITVSSEPNKGSCFSITIPYRTDDNFASMPVNVVEETINNVINQQKDLLLLTTIDEKSKHLTQLAMSQGYKTHKIFSSASLVKHIKFNPPQLVVVDNLIPLEDNFDILDKVNTLTTSLPILYLRDSVRLNQQPFGTPKLDDNELLSAIASHQNLLQKNSGDMKVLVVDDDPHSVELISRSLEENNYNVLRTYSGEEAIETALSDKPDIIVLDLIMPNVSGYDVISAVRNAKDTANIGIIILTAVSLSHKEIANLSHNALSIICKSNLSDTRYDDHNNINTSKISPKIVILTEDQEKQQPIIDLMLKHSFNCTTVTSDQLTSHEDIEAPDLIMTSYVHDSSQIRFYLNKISQLKDRNLPPLLIYNNLEMAFDVNSHQPPNLLMDVTSIIGLHPHNKEQSTVLIIDDDMKAIDILSTTLHEADFKVIYSTNGREGLALAKQHQPEAIILDLIMSDLNGFDVVEGLKNDSCTKNIPLIVLTSKDLSPKERSLLSNHVDIIAQKFDTRRRELISNIQKLIQRGDHQ